VENTTKKIKFSDLSIWLKIAIIGGVLSLCEEIIAFIINFLKGFVGAL
jgi:hypothetical protein